MNISSLILSILQPLVISAFKQTIKETGFHSLTYALSLQTYSHLNTVPAPHPVNLGVMTVIQNDYSFPFVDNSVERSGLLWWEVLSHFLPLFRKVQVMYISLQTRRAALATSDTLVESHYQQTSAVEKGLQETLVDKYNTNVYGNHGRVTQADGTPWMAKCEWVSLFFNHYTEEHLEKTTSSQQLLKRISAFLPLWWLIAVKKIKQDINHNATQKLWRAYSCQVLSSHAYQGQLRAQSNAQNWNCGWWDFIVGMWAPGCTLKWRSSQDWAQA